jgi:hypothetical protein
MAFSRIWQVFSSLSYYKYTVLLNSFHNAIEFDKAQYFQHFSVSSWWNTMKMGFWQISCQENALKP